VASGDKKSQAIENIVCSCTLGPVMGLSTPLTFDLMIKYLILWEIDCFIYGRLQPSLSHCSFGEFVSL